MKNEYKIDYVSIHEDGDLTQRSFGNKGGALERGSRRARAGSISKLPPPKANDVRMAGVR